MVDDQPIVVILNETKWGKLQFFTLEYIFVVYQWMNSRMSVLMDLFQSTDCHILLFRFMGANVSSGEENKQTIMELFSMCHRKIAYSSRLDIWTYAGLLNNKWLNGKG